MKKILLSLLAIAAVFVSCKKEASVESESSKTITIAASCDDVTKTTYTDAGVFSWSSGDRISYVVKSTVKVGDTEPTGKFNMYSYITYGTSANASFSGSAPSGQWTAYNYAYYPNFDGADPQASNKMSIPATTTLQATLGETIVAAEDRLSGIIPMIGVKTGTDASGTVDHYHFYPVTGVLKVSFSGLPATASQICLTVPDAATYPLNGTFNIDTGRAIPEIKASDVSTGNELKNLSFVYASSADAFYFPLPTGTIPAGKLTVSVTDGTNILYSVKNTESIDLVRGEITEIPVISVPSVTVKFSSNHQATIYFSGDVKKVSWTTAQNASYTFRNNQINYVTTSGTVINLGNSYTEAGIRYFGYSAYNDSDANKDSDDSYVVETYNSIPYYNPSLSASVLGSYSWKQPAGGKSSEVNTHGSEFGATLSASPTITFSASDNISKGNIMITSFCGKTTRKVYGFFKDSSTDLVFKSGQSIFIESGIKYYIRELFNENVRFRLGSDMAIYDTTADMYCQGSNFYVYHGVFNAGSSDYDISFFLADKD